MSDEAYAKAQAAIPELRAMTGQAGSMYSDTMMARFLVARDCDCQKAKAMLIGHSNWRMQFGADNLLKESYKDIASHYRSGFVGYDKRENPVYVEFPFKSDLGGLLEKYKTEQLLRWHCSIMETGRKLYEAKASRGVFVIIDATGLSMSHANKVALDYIKVQSALDQDNYPEHLAYCFVINAGMVFTGAFKLVSVFLDANTKAKVKVLGSDYIKELSNYLDVNMLPPELGGKRPMPEVSAWGADDPRWSTQDFTQM